MSQSPEDIKRWTAGRKATAVMDIIKAKTTPSELARSQANTTKPNATSQPDSHNRLSNFRGSTTRGSSWDRRPLI
ncbi:MAG: hypothetical protein EON58_18375 [Alphaproteobacteria bacterium]|nr:MAG: hypothetical protein EON58_18375 [Alphaproteobacteria bacterium]